MWSFDDDLFIDHEYAADYAERSLTGGRKLAEALKLPVGFAKADLSLSA